MFISATLASLQSHRQEAKESMDRKWRLHCDNPPPLLLAGRFTDPGNCYFLENIPDDMCSL